MTELLSFAPRIWSVPSNALNWAILFNILINSRIWLSFVLHNCWFFRELLRCHKDPFVGKTWPIYAANAACEFFKVMETWEFIFWYDLGLERQRNGHFLTWISLFIFSPCRSIFVKSFKIVVQATGEGLRGFWNCLRVPVWCLRVYV